MELMSIKKGLDVVADEDTDESQQQAKYMTKSASDFYKKSKRSSSREINSREKKQVVSWLRLNLIYDSVFIREHFTCIA